MYKELSENINGNKKTKIVLQETRYKIEKQIGSGTFGKVFQALDIKNNKKVAIKEAFQDKKYKNRELQVLSCLQHQNIVDMKDHYFQQNGQDKFLYIVMDIYDSNLQILFKQMRKQKKKFQNIEIKIMGFQLFKALYYLSLKKVCHRDLKPPNILVNSDTLQIRVCDFGSAKVFNQIERNVTYICSRYYRSPQLIFQYPMYGTQVDVWAAGCILVEFLTKQPLFPGDSTVEQLIQVIKVLGAPSLEYINKYGKQYKQTINFPHIPGTKWERVLKKYQADALLIDLISKILIYDTQKRLKPYQILTHPYFSDMINPQNRIFIEKLPNIFMFQKLQFESNKQQIQNLQRIYNRSKKYKVGVLSIQKQLGECSKMETGDCTPLQSKSKSSLVGTSDTIN